MSIQSCCAAAPIYQVPTLFPTSGGTSNSNTLGCSGLWSGTRTSSTPPKRPCALPFVNSRLKRQSDCLIASCRRICSLLSLRRRGPPWKRCGDRRWLFSRTVHQGCWTRPSETMTSSRVSPRSFRWTRSNLQALSAHVRSWTPGCDSAHCSRMDGNRPAERILRLQIRLHR